jgi:hypothetical protein
MRGGGGSEDRIIDKKSVVLCILFPPSFFTGMVTGIKNIIIL